MLVQEFPLTTVLELRQNSKGQEISRRKKSLGQGFSHMVDVGRRERSELRFAEVSERF